jgi:peptidoglycan/LPS O-acetylase OafA/YrhL
MISSSIQVSNEKSSVAPRPGARIQALDSLRGVAALSVVFHHCLATFPIFWAVYESDKIPVSPFVRILAFSPAHLLWGGLEAVIIFYVLSGFVLTFPFCKLQPPSYQSFVLKRVCRIYVPYLVIIVSAALLLNTISTFKTTGLSSWFNQFWNQPVSWLAIIDHLFMLGSARWNYIDPVVWSLVHEMRISLIFPGLIWLIKKVRFRLLMPGVLLFSLAAKFVTHSIHLDGFIPSLLETASYLFLFVAGAELAIHSSQLKNVYVRLSTSTKCMLLIVSLALLNARWMVNTSLQSVSVLMVWAGAIVLVAMVSISSRLGLVLGHHSFNFLGRISYSLYLVHIVILFALMHWLQSVVSPVVLAIFVLPLSLVVATGFHQLVEVPSMNLGRTFEAKTNAHQLESANRSLDTLAA